MICEDWRDTPSEVIAPLLGAEEQRWAQHLGWELGPALRLAEDARRTGVLPGIMVRSRFGEPLALSVFEASHGVVRIRVLTGASAGALRLTLDRLCLSAEAQVASLLTCLVFPTTTSVASALARQRFALQSRPYLSRPLGSYDGIAGGRVPVRPWTIEDLAPATRLLARAYAGESDGHCFAGRGRLDEWARHVGQLLRSPVAGAFEPAWSFVAESRGDVLGLVLCTRVAPGTAHIAQVAADPSHRRRGIGASLMAAACRAARRDGMRRVTLQVGEQNVVGCAFTAHAGFMPTAWSFLYGHRGPIARRGGTRSDDLRDRPCPASAEAQGGRP